MPRYVIRKINKMVCEVEVHLEKSENDFSVFFAPDAHWDNPKCERELLKSHMDKAKRESALIIMPGDTFCFMQGKYDPRRSKSDIRPEHNVANYIDAVIEDAAKWFAPYKDNLILGKGNHETAILKNLETDVLDRFVGAMGGGTVMGYQGWVILKIIHCKTHKATQKIYFHHGSGGGGPVTRGQIGISRFVMHIENADVIATGHIHEKSGGDIMSHYIEFHSVSGYTAKVRAVTPIIPSTYKQEYQSEGFHTEKGRPPKPLGGVFVTFHGSRAGDNGSYQITRETRLFSTPTFTLK